MGIRITGKNGGDFNEYWRAVKLATNVAVSDAIAAGKFLIRKIRYNTARGLDYKGSPFERYSDDYAKRTGKTKVDLKVSGDMLGALQVSVNGQTQSNSVRGSSKEVAHSMGVGIYDDAEQAQKGRIHNEGYLGRIPMKALRPKGRLRKYVMRIPKRRWLDADANTVHDIEDLIAGRIETRAKAVV